MPDSGEIDKALVNRLATDATLLQLCPDGVWFDTAAQGKTKFVLCAVAFSTDTGQMATGIRRATEVVIYEVKAILMDSSGSKAGQAAARIDQLLEDQPLSIPGYHCGAIYRVERIRTMEVDDTDPNIRWQHRGGQYRVQVTPVQGGTS